MDGRKEKGKKRRLTEKENSNEQTEVQMGRKEQRSKAPGKTGKLN
jgi:hypothetical protein